MKESKSERFRRLAEARTNKILLSIISLGKLSNKSNYEYKETDVDKIFNTIEKELRKQRELFTQEKRKERRFKL